MSAAANWSYTAIATFWKQLGIADNGDPLGYAPPVQILCDYGGDARGRIGSIGVEINIKNVFWTEFFGAEKGDYILIGPSDNPDPVAAGADEVMHVIRYADTFDRVADDFAIITGA
ncbi:hypothetical protein RF656_15635 [Yersinia kristensenii]|uniref:hypothetical protein n=1 Tax=Yersinia kristensenii TaxID=28152 RepID=UPI00285303FB|nr:hypothetical protein [Yersinia kristensenii]MDR4898163.1 hypothetical protein [Yersinia kristensenii]